MNQRELGKEGVDLKLVLLLLLKKVWIIIGAALAGAVICGGIYALWHGKLMDNRKYEAQSKYYITFEETMEKSYLDFHYNGHTWDDLLSADVILGYAMELLPKNYNRGYVDECIEAWILSDARVLTTVIRANTLEETILIQAAVEEAVIHYAQVGDKLEQIVVIRSDEPQLETIADETIRAALFGAAVIAIFTVLGVLLWIAVQDAVYLPEEFEVRYASPVAGIRPMPSKGENIEKKEEALRKHLACELENGLSHICKGKRCETISMQELYALKEDAFRKLEQAEAVVLEFPQGVANSKKLAHVMWMLKARKCPVLCAVMTEADLFIIRHYYGM